MNSTGNTKIGHTDSLQPRRGPEERSSGRRPRLLFLARPFPPSRSAACPRTWNIAKSLARLGWDVTVVTPHPSVWRHIDSPEDVEARVRSEGIKRVFSDHRWRCLDGDQLNCQNEGLGWLIGGICRVVARRLGIDSGVGWRLAAEQACSSLSKGDADLILATALPVSAFRLAKKLSDRLGCPYVMDYRDPWTQNPHRETAVPLKMIQEEERLLAGSAAVTIVSPSWGEILDQQHGVRSKLHVVTNGYDAEDLAQVVPAQYGHFAIVYAGIFYPPKRVITPIMLALKRLQEEFNGAIGEHYFHYYGPHQTHVIEAAKQAGVSERVVNHGLVSQAEALAAVKGANVAVVITTVFDEPSREEQGIVTGKIFEAVGLRTPILLICPSGSDAESVIRETGLGQAFRGSDIDGIADFLRGLISGRAGRSKNITEYSWANIGRKLDRILRGVLETRSGDNLISGDIQSC
jgi:glycosyltransferase involved in cell wall biosynthesis